ncbi:MAG: SDR family oxidoreductase [Ignavibacteriales bacterium]|nr:MAG: SDR family oxidoreductase [Ignavibacteriales bacterium]
MKVLVLGATGATGILVVKQLLNRNVSVKVVARAESPKLNELKNNDLLQIIIGNISEFDLNKNLELISDCNAVVCCLGHNISFKGLYGKPRRLVTDSLKNICEAITKSKKENVKLILMNTTGNMNIKIKENYSLADRIVMSLLYFILPPHKDNVTAAEYLSENITENNPNIEWTAVRPDSLTNEEKVSGYEIIESPKRSPIFDAGNTSRINVSHFMIELLMNEELWNKWKFKMPVIYNS